MAKSANDIAGARFTIQDMAESELFESEFGMRGKHGVGAHGRRCMVMTPGVICKGGIYNVCGNWHGQRLLVRQL